MESWRYRAETGVRGARPRDVRIAGLHALPRRRRRRDVAVAAARGLAVSRRAFGRPRRGSAGRPPPDALSPLARRRSARTRSRAVARPVQLPAGVPADDQLRGLALRA